MPNSHTCPLCTHVSVSVIGAKVHIWKYHPSEAEALMSSINKNTFKKDDNKVKVLPPKEAIALMHSN